MSTLQLIAIVIVNCFHLDLLASNSNESVELQSVDNARRLYSSCTNETNIDAEGVERILSLIDTDFGGWPILQGESWNESTFDFSNLIFRLRQYNYNILYRVGTDVDEKNSSITDIVVRKSFPIFDHLSLDIM